MNPRTGRYLFALIVAVIAVLSLYKIFYDPWGTAEGVVAGYGCEYEKCSINVKFTAYGKDYEAIQKTLYDQKVWPERGDKIKVTYLKEDPTQLKPWDCPYKKYNE